MSESSSEARDVIEVSDADMAAAAAEETGAQDAEVSEETGGPFSQKTAWVRRMETPLRSFLRTETGSASVLAAATVLALIWANVSISSYEKFWATRLSVTVGSWNVSLDVREFVNSGLMALFFLVVGLEARREFDVGELRVRSRLTLPLLVGLAGMAVPIAIPPCTAGGWRCPLTPPSPSARSPWSGAGCRIASAPTCSPSRSSTT
jgi:hypothetical protein